MTLAKDEVGQLWLQSIFPIQLDNIGIVQSRCCYTIRGGFDAGISPDSLRPCAKDVEASNIAAIPKVAGSKLDL